MRGADMLVMALVFALSGGISGFILGLTARWLLP